MVSELKGMGLEVSGNEPTDDSWVVIKDNEVYDFSLKFDDYVANYDVNTNKVSAIKNGTIELTPEVQAEQDKINNIKQIITAYIEEAKTKNSSLDSETVKSVSDMTDVVIENGPVEGWIHFDVTDDGVVIKDYSLKVDNYVADYSEDITVTKNGALRDMPVVPAIYYNTEWIGANPVYYNPVTGVKCDNYHEDNSKTGYNGITTNGEVSNNTVNNNGCLKWYAYSEQDGNVNLLLDHNINKSFWIKFSDYDKSYDAENGAQSLGITYPSGLFIPFIPSVNYYTPRNKGPITLLNQLKADTNGWNTVLNRTDSYTISNVYDAEGDINGYTINYSEYKARLITAQEVAYIVGFDSWDEKSASNSHFYFDSQGTSALATCKSGDTSGCSYGWLYDRTSTSCTNYGCLNNSDSDVYNFNYWTVSNCLNYFQVWYVNSQGFISSYYASGGFQGLRPVITVPKSSIFES